MESRAVCAAAGIALSLCLLGLSAPVQAHGVIYVVGGRTGPTHTSLRGPAAAARVDALSAPTDDGATARGVILTGARLTTGSDTSVAMPSAPSLAVSCADCPYATMVPLIRAVAQVTNTDAALVAAVIDVESGFNRYAVSSTGARGLMQLMPATAMRFGVSDVTDPVQNIAAGSLYLNLLLRHFSGNLRDALAAYNAGEANVRNYGGVPPFAETQAYVPRVLARYATFRTRFGLANDVPAAASGTRALPMLLAQ